MQEDLLEYEPKIRKIMLGIDLKSAMTFQVGIAMNGGTVVVKAITISQSDAYFFSIQKYNIWVEHDGKLKKWKSYVGVPISIEYEL